MRVCVSYQFFSGSSLPIIIFTGLCLTLRAVSLVRPSTLGELTGWRLLGTKPDASLKLNGYKKDQTCTFSSEMYFAY